MKSIVSELDNVPLDGINVIVLPATVKAVVGAWITPFKDTSIWFTDSGVNATLLYNKL